jgi:hypothetical protein
MTGDGRNATAPKRGCVRHRHRRARTRRSTSQGVVQLDRTAAAWLAFQSGCKRRKTSSPRTFRTDANTGEPRRLRRRRGRTPSRVSSPSRRTPSTNGWVSSTSSASTRRINGAVSAHGSLRLPSTTCGVRGWTSRWSRPAATPATHLRERLTKRRDSHSCQSGGTSDSSADDRFGGHSRTLAQQRPTAALDLLREHVHGSCDDEPEDA